MKTTARNIIALLVSLCIGHPILANQALANTKIDEALKKRNCVVGVGSMTAEYERLNEIWLTNPDTRYNISLNLQSLDTKHTEYMSQVESFRSNFKTQAEKLTDISQQITVLDENFRQQFRKLSAVAQADEVFTSSLNSLHETLSSMVVKLNKLSSECGDTLSEERTALATDVVDWKETIGKLVSYTEMTKEKRKNFLLIVNESLRLELEKNWAIKAGENLAALHNRIQKILDVLALQRTILNWYKNFATSGEVSNLRNQYLQYEAPLRALYAGLNQGREFLKKLNAIDAPANVDAELRPEILGYLTTIESAIRDLEKAGWEGTFARHKMLNQKRLTMLDKLTSGCKPAIDEYNQKTAAVKVQSDFRIAEQFYFAIYDNCKLK